MMKAVEAEKAKLRDQRKIILESRQKFRLKKQHLNELKKTIEGSANNKTFFQCLWQPSYLKQILWVTALSSLVEGNEGLIGPSGKLLCLRQTQCISLTNFLLD